MFEKTFRTERYNTPTDQYKFSKQEILLLLNQLPNLGEIDIGSSKYCNDYLGFFLDADKQSINKITVESFNPFFGLYFLACYKFREYISCMTLHYCESTLNFNSQEINVLHSLTQFKQLTQLEFYNKHDMNLTPYHVQDVCPRLKHFAFVPDYPISESMTLRLLESSSKINLDFIASLSQLYLDITSLLATYTRYLVGYFSDQLLRLTIGVSRQNFFKWLDIVGMELALKFMEKLIQANKDSKTTRYFRLLNVFNGNRRTHCSTVFGEPDGLDETIISFDNSIHDTLTITYNLYDNDSNGLNGGGLVLSDKSSSIIGPEIFTELVFDIVHATTESTYQALNYALLNCPKLQSFEHEKKSSCDPTNCEINCLEIEYLGRAQTYFDLAATHLHHLELVLVENDGWGRLYDDCIVNLTALKNLKTFRYFPGIYVSKKCDDDFVLFKYTNGEEDYYYIDKEKNKKCKSRVH
ncbi:hypothetical protein EDC94DRAFT_672060 [Helicostylum pulchrum]|nr:hypothetical protein EDC94DRAFT_672060 [Helicostylum pulchrum]